MDKLRDEARQALQKDLHNLPPVLPSAMKVKGDLSELWENVSQHDNSSPINVSIDLNNYLNVMLTATTGLRKLVPCIELSGNGLQSTVTQ